MQAHKILIIEDELTLLSILKDKFQLEGFKVITTQSAEKALEIAKDEKPDIILTDLIMYPINGIELIRRIRDSGDWGEGVPCIILSNENREDLKPDIKELRIAKYINKADIPLDNVVSEVIKIIK